ncbi:MAG: hypothetical protein AAF658_21785, partial [Myxococcota bacterium]
MTAPFLNLATTTDVGGQRTVDATLFTNVTGGTFIDFEAPRDILLNPTEPFITGLVVPSQADAGTFSFVAPTDLTFESAETQGGSGSITRQITPFSFLSATNETFSGRSGYPTNVFRINAQGLYGIEVEAQTDSTSADRVVTVIAKSTNAIPSAGDTSLTPQITDTHLFHLPVNTTANACSETLSSIVAGNGIPTAQLRAQFNNIRKPFVFQATRFIGSNGPIRCYEHQVRLENPFGSLDNITIPFLDGDTRTFGIRATVPGATGPRGDVRILAITACDPNAADRSSPTGGGPSGGAGSVRCLDDAGDACMVMTPDGTDTTCASPFPDTMTFTCPDNIPSTQPPTTGSLN